MKYIFQMCFRKSVHIIGLDVESLQIQIYWLKSRCTIAIKLHSKKLIFVCILLNIHNIEKCLL